MLTTKSIPLNKSFVGREHELNRLSEISSLNESGIVIVYGRRRVGKTELLEQALRNRNIIKLEGIEGYSQQEQIEAVLHQFSAYCSNPLIKKLRPKNWTEVFETIGSFMTKGTWTLYLEEIQWMANYSDDLIAELKYVWDNLLRYNRSLILVLCGSSPSFMLNDVIRSKALYNRSLHEIPLGELGLSDIRSFLGKNRSINEVMDACLCVGGIPEYLKYLKTRSSIFLSLCYHAFSKGGFFSNEYLRIFTSSLAGNKNYQKVIEYLGKRRFATRNDILTHLKTESGGTLSNLLTDLELCGFIDRYTPYNLKENSLLARYCICDQYLQFFFKFIKPIQKDIEQGTFNNAPTTAINSDSFQKWLGFAFERWCRKNHRIIARILGFESVRYRSGAFFNRSTQKESPNFQIDLLFERMDKVITVCEIKYLKAPASKKLIAEFEKKIALFSPGPKFTIQRVLISAEGADKGLTESGYFDRIIALKDIFQAS
jgi:AAA+ ATPase superfamily predicted ATPase